MVRKAQLVTLTAVEKPALLSLTKTGTHKSRKIIRARLLLLLDEGKNWVEVQAQVGVDPNHFYRIKRRYFEGGLPAALEELPRSDRAPGSPDYQRCLQRFTGGNCTMDAAIQRKAR